MAYFFASIFNQRFAFLNNFREVPALLGELDVAGLIRDPADELAALGLSRDPADILSAGKFQIPPTQEFDDAMNKEFEKIKAGF